MKAKKKYEEGGILDKLKEAKKKIQERQQFKKDVKSGKVVKVTESRDIGAAEGYANRNNGTVRYKKGVYSVYKKN
jgi:hypothetical protein